VQSVWAFSIRHREKATKSSVGTGARTGALLTKYLTSSSSNTFRVTIR
jgi:hypothetical protein